MNLTQTILMMSLVVMITAEMQNRNRYGQDDKSLKQKRDAGDPPECETGCPGQSCKLRLKI